MGCTHSRNSKSKAAKSEHPLERQTFQQNRVAHFDETNQSTHNNSNESSESTVQPPYSKTILQEREQKAPSDKKKHKFDDENKEDVKKSSAQVIVADPAPKPPSPEKIESIQHTAIPPVQQKQAVSSTYYPMPTVGEKQNSPEKKKLRKKSLPVEEHVVVEEKKKKEPLPREKSTMIGPNFRPQLSPDDLECIKRSVQQRNERRAYMMTHRNETDDTLYELDLRMPEKDYTMRLNGVY